MGLFFYTAMSLSRSTLLAFAPALGPAFAQDGDVTILRISIGIHVVSHPWQIPHPWQVRDIRAKSAQNVVGQERSRSLNRAGHQGKKVPLIARGDIIYMNSFKQIGGAAGRGYLFLCNNQILYIGIPLQSRRNGPHRQASWL